MLAVAVADTTVRVWDLATGELAAGPLDDWAAGRAGLRWPGRSYLCRHPGHQYDSDADGYDDIALQVWNSLREARSANRL